MNLAEEICGVLCAGLTVRKVPVGYAVSTPWAWYSGDPLTFFVRVEGDKARLEDSGLVMSDLQGMGLDLASESRRTIMASILEDHHVSLIEDDSMFATEWVPSANVAASVPEFVSFLLRIPDLLFLNKERVVSTFREDLAEAVKEKYEGQAEIFIGEAPIENMPHYIVDILVAHRSGKYAAIFAGVSDVAVLQAVLFQKELEIRNIAQFTSFLVFEDLNGAKVSQRNRSIAINSDLEVADWGGGRGDVIEKVFRHVH